MDIVDLEDFENNMRTPAVMMGEVQAKWYAAYCILATCVVHAASPIHFVPVDMLLLSLGASLIFESEVIAASTITAIVIAYLLCYDVEILGFFLRSTEQTHKFAISATLDAVEFARDLPSPWKQRVLECTIQMFKIGDFMGSQLLHLYETVLRGDMLER